MGTIPPRHSVPLELEQWGGRGHGLPEGRVWRARLPLSALPGATVLLRDGQGEVRSQHPLRALR